MPAEKPAEHSCFQWRSAQVEDAGPTQFAVGTKNRGRLDLATSVQIRQGEDSRIGWRPTFLRFERLIDEHSLRQQRSEDFAGHCGGLEWPFADAGDCPIHIAEKPLGEPRTLVVVPSRGSLEIGLGALC